MKTFRVITYVPETHVDIVRKAIGDAGGGMVGNYSHCSFSTKGTGRFTPVSGAHPAIGSVGVPEEVLEERVEFYCAEELLEKVAAAIRSVHPYEEVPIDAAEVTLL